MVGLVEQLRSRSLTTMVQITNLDITENGLLTSRGRSVHSNGRVPHCRFQVQSARRLTHPRHDYSEVTRRHMTLCSLAGTEVSCDLDCHSPACPGIYQGRPRLLSKLATCETFLVLALLQLPRISASAPTLPQPLLLIFQSLQATSRTFYAT